MGGLGVFAVVALVYLQLMARSATPGPGPGTIGSFGSYSWLNLLLQVLALVASGLGGAVFTYRFVILPKERASTSLLLLGEALRISALVEAWIVDAVDSNGAPTHQALGLPS